MISIVQYWGSRTADVCYLLFLMNQLRWSLLDMASAAYHVNEGDPKALGLRRR